MFERIYFLYNFNSYLSENTLAQGIDGLAKHLNVPYHRICLTKTRTDRDFDSIPSTNDQILVFVIYDQNRTDEIDRLRKRCPNVYLVQWGGDTHYTWKSSLFQADLFLDPMPEVVDTLNSKGCVARKVFWTISQQYLDKILEYDGNREKSWDLICMCNRTPERDRFFTEVFYHFTLLTYLNEYNTDTIIHLYNRTRYTLGISSTCFQESKYNAKSRKGLRDYIGPFCNSLFVTDDKSLSEDMGLIPMYEYGSAESLKEVITYLDNNPDIRDSYLTKEQAFVKENTIDKQLIRIIAKQ